MTLTRTRLLAIMIGTTFFVAWAPLVALAVRHVPFEGAVARALIMFQSFAPLVGALVAQAVLPKREGVPASLGLVADVNRFWFVAWLAPVVFVAIAIGFSWLAFGLEPVLTAADVLRHKRSAVSAHDLEAFDRAVSSAPMQSPIKLLLMALPAGFTLNLIPALASEVGLRGFLYREVPGTFFPRALRIGLVHGLVQIPATLLGWGFPEHPLLGVPFVIVNALLFGLAALYVRARAGSVVPVALLHGTFLALAHPSIDLTFGASDWQRPTTGLGGTFALALMVLAFAVHDLRFARAKLMFPPAKQPDSSV